MLDVTRRTWLLHQTSALAVLAVRAPKTSHAIGPRSTPRLDRARQARVAAQAERADPGPWQVLAQQAVDAARAAGAQYADARVTRQVVHRYDFGITFNTDQEVIGVSVRALVDGSWGFSASTVLAADEMVRLAQDAVGQARVNAKSSGPWTVELGQIPVATGTWATPHRIDPFDISIEEKFDYLQYIGDIAKQSGMKFAGEPSKYWLRFVRKEQLVVTSEGAHFVQTLYESGGKLNVQKIGDSMSFGDMFNPMGGGGASVHGLDLAGAGWELILDANIPEQLLSGRLMQEAAAKAAIPAKPFQLGRYTLVCDGATMARLVESTLGPATQLDRALGYEANAGGTSWIDDPLGMIGTAQVTSPLVTLTANRSMPRELATVKWDDEGVAPEPFTLIKDGVLVDFQTTREQAAWLAPHYQRHNLPVRSHGCAAAESAHFMPIQHMPNLSLEPSASAVGLQDLVAEVADGILVENGSTAYQDFQGRTGLFGGEMREIKNGKLGKTLDGGVVFFNCPEIWKNLTAIGGASTQAVVGTSGVLDNNDAWVQDILHHDSKGQPPQRAGRSVRAVAAIIPNQPLINPMRKA